MGWETEDTRCMVRLSLSLSLSLYSEADLNNVLGGGKVHPFDMHICVASLPLAGLGLRCVVASAVHICAIDLVDKLNAFKRPVAVCELDDD